MIHEHAVAFEAIFRKRTVEELLSYLLPKEKSK